MLTSISAQQLPGMPVPWRLTVTRTDDGRVVAVQAGPMLLSAFRAGDLEMRDLTICALTKAAASRARPSPPRSASCPPGCRGSAPAVASAAPGAWPARWAPAAAQPCPAAAGPHLRRTGLTPAEIGRKLGVSRSRISELLRQHGVLPAPDSLPGDAWPGDTDD